MLGFLSLSNGFVEEARVSAAGIAPKPASLPVSTAIFFDDDSPDETRGDRASGATLTLGDTSKLCFFRGGLFCGALERPALMSCSSSCDVLLNPRRRMRSSFECGDSSASIRGAFALSSSCMAFMMSSALVGAFNGRLRNRRLLPGDTSSSNKSPSCSFLFKSSSLRFTAAASRFTRFVSAATSRFASSWTLSKVTKKSATSLKIRPPLSALNGSPKNSVVVFIASFAV